MFNRKRCLVLKPTSQPWSYSQPCYTSVSVSKKGNKHCKEINWTLLFLFFTFLPFHFQNKLLSTSSEKMRKLWIKPSFYLLNYILPLHNERVSLVACTQVLPDSFLFTWKRNPRVNSLRFYVFLTQCLFLLARRRNTV